MLEDGRIILFSEDYNSELTSYELVYLTKNKTSELPKKELISFKTLYLDYSLKGKIIEFNKINPKYRVVVETYDLTVYEAAMTKYQTDLATGNASDIIDLGNSNISQLENKGLLEDLYKYIDSDLEFEREDFFQNVLDVYTVNEKLCGITPSVYLITMVAKTKFVGEKKGWTPSEIVELTRSLPEDTKLLEYGSKDEILSMLVSYDLNSYINWETGECKFGSEDFVSLMEFANEFPTAEEYQATFNESTYDYDMMNSEDKIASDKLILIQGYFSNVSDYQSTMNRFSEPAVCIGFPCMEGNGTSLGSSSSVLGMNANSNNKEGVWEFIRYVLTEELSEDFYGLPINKNVYNKMIEKAMQPSYFEKDEYIYVPEDQRKISEDGRVERPSSTTYIGNKEEYIYSATQENVDDFTALYESTNSLATYNTEILKIIMEEADGYFKGQKDAKSVADIIQSRLQIFVNESR
jgi:ABC-type glycerol-3-phosphate transport system substrate-binding protein